MLYKDSTRSPEERARDLILRMSVEEKLRQLYKIGGWVIYEKSNNEIKLKDEYKDIIGGDGLGAMWAFFRADWWTGKNWDTGITPSLMTKAVNNIQKYAIENTRLGIPIFLAEECAHGLMALGTTVFPTGLSQASTFNKDLIRKMGEAIAKEMTEIGAHIAYGPVLDLARDPRWSRVEEGYGEDPYLASELGEAFVYGLQTENFTGEKGQIISTLKHFAAHGEPEGGHNSAEMHLGERELFNMHHRAFEKCIKAGAISIMSSYNAIDGVPCTGSKKLLRKTLREAWGFEGFVVSDAGAVRGICNGHRIAKDYPEAAAIAIKAGVDIELGAIEYLNSLKEAFSKGLVPIETINESVYNVLLYKFKMGLFERPYLEEKPANIATKEHKDIALEVARQSLTLLSNKDKVLPLKGISSIAVIGPNADTPMNQLGDYTAPQKRESIKTVLDGMKLVEGDIKVNYAKGCKVRSLDKSGFSEAISVAQASDAVILVLGGSSSPEANTGFLDNGAARVNEIKQDSDYDKDSGEGYDRAHLDIAGVQLELLSELKKTGKKVVVVLIQGRPLKIEKILNEADAVLLAWYPGMEGGTAVAECLLGKINPCGRLPISIPLFEGQLPVYYNAMRKKASYIDLTAEPLLKFGFGLSYTEFEYLNLQLEGRSISVDVKNIGDYDGYEVVQLYITDKNASIVRPDIELKGFKKIFLKKGETQKVTFEITDEAISFYNEEMKFGYEKGEFIISVGGSQEKLNKVILTV